MSRHEVLETCGLDVALSSCTCVLVFRNLVGLSIVVTSKGLLDMVVVVKGLLDVMVVVKGLLDVMVVLRLVLDEQSDMEFSVISLTILPEPAHFTLSGSAIFCVLL